MNNNNPTKPCIHNARCRYENGFYCEDCNTYFDKCSPTYRGGELLSSIWMVLHNINVDRMRQSLVADVAVAAMEERIGVGKQHDNYEDIISKAEALIAVYGKNSESASILLGEHTE